MLCHKGIEAHVHCTDYFPSFVRFDWFSEAFWAKKRCFGAQNVLFCEGPSRLGAPPIGDFLPHNLDLARGPPRLLGV